MDVCMQYESNPANAFRDIVRKQNTDARSDMVMTTSSAPTSWAGDDNTLMTFVPEGILPNRLRIGQLPFVFQPTQLCYKTPFSR